MGIYAMEDCKLFTCGPSQQGIVLAIECVCFRVKVAPMPETRSRGSRRQRIGMPSNCTNLTSDSGTYFFGL